jgi:S-adenosylmethionine hydrolase
MRPDLVVLLTDFGPASPYVGIMKAVLFQQVGSRVTFLDLAHNLRPQDVEEAARTLECAWPYLPENVVIVGVVDPGVGSKRRAVAVRLTGERVFVGPDNGMLTPLLEHTMEAVQLPIPADASPTFHGRDVFAPAAARLLQGTPLNELGPPLDPSSLVRLPWPTSEETEEGWTGTVRGVDPFGNLITSFHKHRLPPLPFSSLRVGDRILPVVRTFSDVEEGELLAYWGSCGYLEIAARNGSAVSILGLHPKPLVLLRP